QKSRVRNIERVLDRGVQCGLHPYLAHHRCVRLAARLTQLERLRFGLDIRRGIDPHQTMALLGWIRRHSPSTRVLPHESRYLDASPLSVETPAVVSALERCIGLHSTGRKRNVAVRAAVQQRGNPRLRAKDD